MRTDTMQKSCPNTQIESQGQTPNLNTLKTCSAKSAKCAQTCDGVSSEMVYGADQISASIAASFCSYAHKPDLPGYLGLSPDIAAKEDAGKYVVYYNQPGCIWPLAVRGTSECIAAVKDLWSIPQTGLNYKNLPYWEQADSAHGCISKKQELYFNKGHGASDSQRWHLPMLLKNSTLKQSSWGTGQMAQGGDMGWLCEPGCYWRQPSNCPLLDPSNPTLAKFNQSGGEYQLNTNAWVKDQISCLADKASLDSMCGTSDTEMHWVPPTSAKQLERCKTGTLKDLSHRRRRAVWPAVSICRKPGWYHSVDVSCLIEFTVAAGIFFPFDSCPNIASSSEWEVSYGVITGGTEISTLQVLKDTCTECVSACLASVNADGLSNCYAIRYSRNSLYDTSRRSFFNLNISGTVNCM